MAQGGSRHYSITRMACPSSNSVRQMAHSSSPSSTALLGSTTYVSIGSKRSTSFLTPLFAVATAPCGVRPPAAAVQLREHEHHLTRPRMHECTEEAGEDEDWEEVGDGVGRDPQS
jgi:hypothetical protein